MHSNPSNPYRLLREGNPTARQAGPLRVLPEPLKRLTKICVVWEATGEMEDFEYKHIFSRKLKIRNNELVLIVDFIVEKIIFKGYNLVLLFLLFWKGEPPQIIEVRDARYCVDLAPDKYYVTDAIVEK